MSREFDAKVCKEELIQWIKDYFAENGPTSKAVIGISGGIDSSLVLALCVEALGKDRIQGVLMPNGIQDDLNYSLELVKLFNINYIMCNIKDIVNAFYDTFESTCLETNEVVTINIPARIRMTMLYAISGAVGGRVSCNCNFSEDYVGYSTKFGDDAGDFAPLKNLLKSEVIAVAKETILPEKYINKVPTDGLCGQSDEERMGFTYDEEETYIKYLEEFNEYPYLTCPNYEKIKKLHNYGLHKVKPIPYYKYYENRRLY